MRHGEIRRFFGAECTAYRERITVTLRTFLWLIPVSSQADTGHSRQRFDLQTERVARVDGVVLWPSEHRAEGLRWSSTQQRPEWLGPTSEGAHQRGRSNSTALDTVGPMEHASKTTGVLSRQFGEICPEFDMRFYSRRQRRGRVLLRDALDAKTEQQAQAVLRWKLRCKTAVSIIQAIR
jgi:hypothetical protein